jgi:hypothetical protein
MDARSNSTKTSAPQALKTYCPHCRAANPARAYCCRSCFKVSHNGAAKKRRFPVALVLAVVAAVIAFMLLNSLEMFVDGFHQRVATEVRADADAAGAEPAALKAPVDPAPPTDPEP